MRTRRRPRTRQGSRRSRLSTSPRRTGGRSPAAGPPGGEPRRATHRPPRRGSRRRFDVDRVRDVGGRVDWRGRPAAPGPAVVRDDVAGDPEEPDTERRRSFAVGRPGALLEAVEVRECGEEGPFGDVFGFVVISKLVVGVAESGPGSVDRGHQSGQGPRAPPRRALDRGRGG